MPTVGHAHRSAAPMLVASAVTLASDVQKTKAWVRSDHLKLTNSDGFSILACFQSGVKAP